MPVEISIVGVGMSNSRKEPKEQHRWQFIAENIGKDDVVRLAITYTLSFSEAVSRVIYPFFIGLSIDGLISGNVWRLGPLLGLWILTLFIGVVRHIYDTKVFTSIYNRLAVKTVEDQRRIGVDNSRIVARIALSREIVDFMQHQAPGVINILILFFGSLVMLFSYDFTIGMVALLGLLPTFATNRWFARVSYRINSALNNRFEREIDIVAQHEIWMVRAHFGRITLLRIKLSNSEAFSWGVMHVTSMVVASAALVRLSSIDYITIGVIYSVMAYIWDYLESIGSLPGLVQTVARISDIVRRISSQT